MDSFHDVRFPTAVSFGATGGPERRVEIVSLTSGRERRNLRQSRSRRHFDAGTGLRSLGDLYEIIAFFEARRGSLHGFRFRDPFDNKSCAATAEPGPVDQLIGVGDGETRSFQLTKSYGLGADAYQREISLPVEGSVKIAIDGAEAAAGIDHLTGTVTFAPPPPVGAGVTAGFAFDIAARFDAERLEISLSAFKAGQIPTIPILELLR